MLAICSLVSFQPIHIEIDPEGRFIFLNAAVYNHTMTIANIYSPNTNQKCFYKTIKKKLEPFKQGSLIICGDFNQITDPLLDASNPVCKRSTSLYSLIHTEDLYDPWRCFHDTERDYTYFSHTQNAYSWIDFFLTDKHTL